MAAIIGQDRKIVSLFPPGHALGRLTQAAITTIGKSFEQQAMRNPTQDEVKRRFEIVMKYAVMLRGDLKWGLDRICDTLPEILRTELLGQRWEPTQSDKRQCWMPGDGAV